MTVISVENLSKSYRLGQIGTFSRDLEVWWAKVRGTFGQSLAPHPIRPLGRTVGETDHGNRGEQMFMIRYNYQEFITRSNPPQELEASHAC